MNWSEQDTAHCALMAEATIVTSAKYRPSILTIRSHCTANSSACFREEFGKLPEAASDKPIRETQHHGWVN